MHRMLKISKLLFRFFINWNQINKISNLDNPGLLILCSPQCCKELLRGPEHRSFVHSVAQCWGAKFQSVGFSIIWSHRKSGTCQRCAALLNEILHSVKFRLYFIHSSRCALLDFTWNRSEKYSSSKKAGNSSCQQFSKMLKLQMKQNTVRDLTCNLQFYSGVRVFKFDFCSNREIKNNF